jgi:hypothetical protein
MMEVENDAKPRVDANKTGTLVIDMHTRIVTFERGQHDSVGDNSSHVARLPLCIQTELERPTTGHGLLIRSFCIQVRPRIAGKTMSYVVRSLMHTSRTSTDAGSPHRSSLNLQAAGEES